MLKIDNLAMDSKELDRAAMSDIRGGQGVSAPTSIAQQVFGDNIGSPIINAPTNVNAPVSVDLTNINKTVSKYSSYGYGYPVLY
ncbi:hypothetical protein [Paraburkholderia atlantica]|uniref:Uncharacterized protein n=1 Tax=Paraburkholderia atlantica TaxID=2654982 RepID=D5WM11_PARAM|nr:hypothetical protein [Paraburkholderia atlantica]ADG20257.1 hypothetical protein BC1002_6406 [Paraburkholderia atlantica]MBB5509318.1 hypothetical protein [Paraburkholderia atlantica]